jgi:hypothetical protein
MQGKANNVRPVFPRTVYHLDISLMRRVTNQFKDNGIFFRWLHKTDEMFKKWRKALFLDLPSLVASCYWNWWSAIQAFSLHVAPTKHQKRRNIHTGSIHVGNNCHEWNPFSWRKRRDPSLTLKRITLHTLCWATVRPVSTQLNKRRGEELISRSNGSNVSKKFATFSFASLFTLVAEVAWSLRSSSRGWRKFTQPLPSCSSLLYWKWTDITIFYGKFKGPSLNTLVVSPENFLSIIRQQLTSSSSKL